MSEHQKNQLLRKLSKGISYAVPAVALAVGAASLHAVVADVSSPDGYQMTGAAESEAEGNAEGSAEGTGESTGAEGSPEATGTAEGSGKAEDSPEASPESQ